MSTTQDLMGLGMPPALADRLGNNPSTVAGVGTTQTGAALIKRGVVLAAPTASNTAFLLSSGTSTGGVLWFYNTSASQTALVYPPSGGAINGGSANASVSIPPLSGATFQLENGSGVAAEAWGCMFGGTVAPTLTPSFTNLTVGPNSATNSPITIQSGTLNTTPAAGVIEFDGHAFYGDVAANQRGIIPTEAFIYVQAAITLLSQTGAQAAFVGTGGVLTNGEITLPTGTYQFEAEFNLSSLSSTSGGFGFALGTANSAVIGQQGWSAYANKATLATPAAPQFSYNTAASTELATATTATVGFVRIEGSFTLTTAGSIIPELSFTTVAGAVTPIVGVGSYFKINPLGIATVTTVGNWS